MHTQPVLQKFFRESLPEIHQARCQALTVAVDAVARGARVTITGLGRRKLANRKVQHRFVDQLKRMVPAHCTPIIIADAGFRVPFYRHVESLGWHWLGRIGNRDVVQWNGAPSDWISAKSLHGIASIRAQDLGEALWVRNHPLAGRLVLIMQHLRGRKHRSLAGSARRGHQSRKHAVSAREPWLLIASNSLQDLNAKQIVRLYKTRMQIEEGFRDTQSVAYGLGIANGRHTTLLRAANLLLIAALASFLLWVIGCLAQARHWHRLVRVNSSSKTPTYSPIFLARLLVQFTRNRLPLSCLDTVARIVRQYTQSVPSSE